MSGSSMNPTLCEPMILETSRFEHYSRGDVVVFTYKNGNTIVHRIVKRTKFGFITSGDNNLTDDEPIVQHDILGKVVAAYRGEKCYRVSEGKNGYRVHRYLQVQKTYCAILKDYYPFGTIYYPGHFFLHNCCIKNISLK